MTTIAVSLRDGMIAADSRNTDSSGAVFSVEKIERLGDGRFFLGSGHLYTIGLVRRWAESGFSEKERPEFGVLFSEKADDYSFSCLIVAADGSSVILVDDEMEPQPVKDQLLAVGSGAGYALGAMDSGLPPDKAVEIAIGRDGSSGGPVQVAYFDKPKRRKR